MSILNCKRSHTLLCVPCPSVMGQSCQPWLFWIHSTLRFQMHHSNPRSVEIWWLSYSIAWRPGHPNEWGCINCSKHILGTKVESSNSTFTTYYPLPPINYKWQGWNLSFLLLFPRYACLRTAHCHHACSTLPCTLFSLRAFSFQVIQCNIAQLK